MQKLMQVLTEEKLSKSNIAKTVLEWIEADNSPIKAKATKAISKTMRKNREFLTENDIEVITYTVLNCISTIDGTELLTVTAGKIARSLEGEYIPLVELAAKLLAGLSDTSVLDVELRGKHLVLVSKYELPEHIRQFILNTSYLPPMLCKPKRVSNNNTSGHLTVNKSLLLGNKWHKFPLNYRAINTLNSVKFELDPRIIELEETSSKPLDTKVKKDNFARNSIAYVATYNYLGNKSFHFPHNYDARGREYCSGWQTNYQGTDYKKASLSLVKKELI